MLDEALALRKKEKLDEPMFRTLLRLRRRDFFKLRPGKPEGPVF
jgi:hypothetical protein